MNLANTPEALLKQGDPHAALQALQAQIRNHPSDAKLRIFLFQLLAVLGQWERAYAQLNMSAQLQDSALAMAQMYREALRCEVIRSKVFAGELTPPVFGQPEQWLALLLEAQNLSARGFWDKAESLRHQAFELAPTTSGTVNGQPFEWIADADMRFGPVIEALVGDTYYWIPLNKIKKISSETPEDLRDLLWLPVRITFVNDGESLALIPARYPGTEASTDGPLLLSRKTEWEEVAPETFIGKGQRVFTTDNNEIPLLEIRELILNSDSPDKSN